MAELGKMEEVVREEFLLPLYVRKRVLARAVVSPPDAQSGLDIFNLLDARGWLAVAWVALCSDYLDREDAL